MFAWLEATLWKRCKEIEIARLPAHLSRMKFPRVFSRFIVGLLLVGVVLSSGCKKPEEAPRVASIIDFSEPTEAQPKLPTIKLWIGPEHMDAEMALQPRQIQ